MAGFQVLTEGQILANGSILQRIYSFDTGSEPPSDQEFKTSKLTEIVCTVPTLTAIAISESEPVWKRVFAMNWLTETDIKAAEALLLHFATTDSQPKQLRLAAVANLGSWQVKTAIDPLVKLLDTKEDALRARVVQALGEIGDARASSAVRPLLKDAKVKFYAVQAAGKLKDNESVPFLLEEVRKGNDDSIPASESLENIATETAVDGLVAIISNNSAHRFARIRAFVALKTIASPKSLGAAAAVLNDNKQKQFHTFAIDVIAALMKGGSTEARTMLTKYAEGPQGDLRDSARKALGMP